jgi:NADPH:quinone reductase-like Zn-dependent oxidoreductase
MRAWQLPQFGLDHLHLANCALEPLGTHDVRIRVTAAALNYRDLLVASGTFLPNLALPFTPCSDAAGIVEAIGPSVTRFAAGDRVYPLSPTLVRWRPRARRNR